MDYQAIIAAVGTGILGIGAVWVTIKNYLPKIKAVTTLLAKAVVFIDDATVALEDENITVSEIEKLKSDGIAIKAAWLTLNAK